MTGGEHAQPHRRVVVGTVVQAGHLTTAPPYLPRPFDAELDRHVSSGGFLVVVGSSSSGKTRAAWEAVRRRLPGWTARLPATAAELTALLGAARGVDVPSRFTADQRARAAEAGDARLREAAERGGDRITQYPAVGPALVEHVDDREQRLTLGFAASRRLLVRHAERFHRPLASAGPRRGRTRPP